MLIGGRSEGGGGTSRGEVVRRGGRLAGGRRPLRWGVVDGGGGDTGGVRREGLQLLLLRAYEREKPVLRPHISTASLSLSLHPSTVGTHDPTLPLPLHLLMQFPQTDSPLSVSPHHLPRARHARVVQIQVQAHAGATPLALGVSMEGAGLRAGVRGEAGV